MPNLLLNLNPALANINTYHVPHFTGSIKIDAMENPYTLPEGLQQDLAKHLGKVSLNRYPDSNNQELIAKILAPYQKSNKNTISALLGNGSDELLQIIISAVNNSQSNNKTRILSLKPTFSVYKLLVDIYGKKSIDYCEFALQQDFQLDTAAFIKYAKEFSPNLIIIACPNNPTSVAYPQKDLINIITALPNSLVLLDQAYKNFNKYDFNYLVNKYSNLICLNTFSKIGLAGLRLGYLIADKGLITEFNKIRLPYNINSLSIAALKFVLEHEEVLEQQIQRIIATKQNLLSNLEPFVVENLITVYPSATNFLTLRLARQFNSCEVYQTMLDNKILIKNLDLDSSNTTSLLSNCIRITIGTDSEMAYFFKVLQRILKRPKIES